VITMFICTKRKIKSCLANITYRDMAKLREFGLHIIFKWLCAPASQDIRAQAKAS
jgi:hypothetical protein